MSPDLAVCGVDCTACEYKKNTQCAGCAEIQGRVWWAKHISADVCPIYRCAAMEKQLDHCGMCADMPCQLWRDLKDPNYSDEQHEAGIQERANRLAELTKP